ncbi:MAG: S-adenosylmethionine:tRNA ribosyltransferase-isomerase, partial [Proteobacteria bacterium]|nr:S-adenosylmethionine:tRNA ribosyltransferase-isomerase [Pseudomonadota bacterium]
MPLLKSDYHYQLPDTLIAIHPADRRENSRMMVLNRS